MVALLREFPSVRATFNLVPSLLVQLESFARDEARDRHLEIGLKPADTLSEEERAFCVEQFFHAHRPRMIDPYPRYAELLAQRESNGAGLERAQPRADAVLGGRHPRPAGLAQAGVDRSGLLRARRRGSARWSPRERRFTEEDKATLRAVELELLRRVVPEYREASARGQIEISTSPFYHPILPLLCDTDVYLRTHPSVAHAARAIPAPRGRRGAAVEAVRSAPAAVRCAAVGLWPSEGSVSDAMVPLVSQRGLSLDGHRRGHPGASRSTATSRAMATATFEQPELLYRSYRGRDRRPAGGLRLPRSRSCPI